MGAWCVRRIVRPDIRVPHAKGRLSSIFMVLIMCSLILNLSSLVSVPRDTERVIDFTEIVEVLWDVHIDTKLRRVVGRLLPLG